MACKIFLRWEGPGCLEQKTQMELSSQELEPLVKYHDTQRLLDKGQMLFIWIIRWGGWGKAVSPSFTKLNLVYFHALRLGNF